MLSIAIYGIIYRYCIVSYRTVSRYVSYHDSCIEECIVSWRPQRYAALHRTPESCWVYVIPPSKENVCVSLVKNCWVCERGEAGVTETKVVTPGKIVSYKCCLLAQILAWQRILTRNKQWFSNIWMVINLKSNSSCNYDFVLEKKRAIIFTLFYQHLEIKW